MNAQKGFPELSRVIKANAPNSAVRPLGNIFGEGPAVQVPAEGLPQIIPGETFPVEFVP